LDDDESLCIVFSSTIHILHKEEKKLQWIRHDFDQRIIGLKRISSEAIYIVCQSSEEGFGVRLFNINTIIKNKKASSILLKNIKPGFNGSL
jgi:hypothetical protein